MLRNHWRHHLLSIQAIPPAKFATPIDVRADSSHFACTRKKADITHWKGTLYANLQNTDLNIWKAYFDYPIELNQGTGSVRAWLDLEYAKVRSFNADLELSDWLARLRKVSGRISASEEIGSMPEDGAPTFGSKGHHFSLIDFSIKNNDRLTLPRTTIRESYLPAKGKQLEKYKLTADHLDLHTLGDFSRHRSLTKSQIQMLDDFSLLGKLQDFSAQWQGAYPSLVTYQARGQFKRLTLNLRNCRALHSSKPHLCQRSWQCPRFLVSENVTGSIDTSQSGGTLRLAAEKMTVTLPGYFVQPILLFDRLNVQASWHFQDAMAEKSTQSH